MSNVVSLDAYRQNVERFSIKLNFSAGGTPSVRYMHALCNEILDYTDANNLCALIEGMRTDAEGNTFLDVLTFNHD